MKYFSGKKISRSNKAKHMLQNNNKTLSYITAMMQQEHLHHNQLIDIT